MRTLTQCGGWRSLTAAFALTTTLTAAARAEPFPLTLDALGPPTQGVRGWTFKDIVEVTRIDGTAVDDAGDTAAFILKQPSVETNDVRYALYLGSLGETGARRLTEAAFLGDLSWRPKVGGWTVRGDFGDGVQLYAIDGAGVRRPLVVRPTVGVGGQEGIVSSADQPLRQTGVAAYGWNRDGSALWYLCAVPTPPGEPDRAETDGVVYDPELTSAADFSTPIHAARLELHVLEAASGQDRVVDSWPGQRGLGERVFQPGRVGWNGPNRLVYTMPSVGPDGAGERTQVFDRAGAVRTAPTAADLQAMAPASVGPDVLSLKRATSGQRRLSENDLSGRMRRDLGDVDFLALGGWAGAWRSDDGRAIFGVLAREKLGLFSYPRSAGGDALAATPSSLTHCSFDAALVHGVCSQESQTQAPRLVEVSPVTGQIRPLADPNARYAEIAPLRIEKFGWTNARGHAGWGWVTYPRGYRPGQRYPTVVITHASDARNDFVGFFQWAFPLQVLAERGYLVISANERLVDVQAAPAGGGYDDGGLPPKRVQAAFGLEAVADMEAAAKVWVDRGVADPERLGIAGYSRGAIVTDLTLSQSHLFRAGIAGDSYFYNAIGYWSGAQVHRLYLNLFGGSPYDPKAVANYRAFSPSFRAAQFSGPLLQLFTGYSAPKALELDRALRDAKVPTQLVFFAGETHWFHQPLSQMSAMARSLDWFDDKLRAPPHTIAASKPPPN